MNGAIRIIWWEFYDCFDGYVIECYDDQIEISIKLPCKKCMGDSLTIRGAPTGGRLFAW